MLIIWYSFSISIKIASIKTISICIATYSSAFNSNQVYQMLISNDLNGSRSSRSRDSAGCGECSRWRWRHGNYHNKPRVWRFPGESQSWIVWDDCSILKHDLLFFKMFEHGAVLLQLFIFIKQNSEYFLRRNIEYFFTEFG